MYAGNPQFFVYHEDDGSPEGCTTTFEIVDDFVESFDYEGKGCVGGYDTYRYGDGKYRQRYMRENTS